MESSKLGIGIPVYNGADTLLKTLWSIRGQTFTNYFIFVVDDSSTDSTWNVIQEGKRMFSEGHIFAYQFPTNRGIQKTRNHLFDFFASSAVNYFMYIDDDIELHPGLFERMVTTLDSNQEYAYVYTDFQWEGLYNHIQKGMPFDPVQLRQRNYISMMSMIRLVHALKLPQPLIDEELERLEDWALWLNFLNHGYSGYYLPGVGFRAFIRQGDNSARGTMDYYCWQKIVNEKYNSEIKPSESIQDQQ